MKIGEPFNPYKKFNGIFIPEQMVCLSDLSPGAKIGYGRLLRYAGKNGACYPSVGALAEEIGVGARQAQNYLAELQQRGFIRKFPRPGTSDRIEFLWHEAFEQAGVKDSSPPGVKNNSRGVKDRSPQGCTKVHPKRVSEDHHQESHFEESHAHPQVSGRLGEAASSDIADVAVGAPLREPPAYASPDQELIAFVGQKGQELTAATLRRIREDLEVQGVTLEHFVAAVRPHFQNNITNSSGFLLRHARSFRRLTAPAVARPPEPIFVDRCERCHEPKGQGLIMEGAQIVPCPACTTAEFQTEFAKKEARRRSRLSTTAAEESNQEHRGDGRS